MSENNNIFLKKEKQDHRTIAKELDLYILDERAGQGLPLLLPNWVVIRNKIVEFLQKKQKEFGFQEVITPILGSEELYKTSGHLAHYQDSMFPAVSRNNETLYLRPMTCPHHCLIYRQKTRSYRDLPLRLCENSILHRYEASGGLKGLERPRWFELADHHIFVSQELLKEEIKKNYHYIVNILDSFGFRTQLICALHDSKKPEKYHPDKNLWESSERILLDSLIELGLKRKGLGREKDDEFKEIEGEAAFYGPKLDFEIQAADGKNITIATIQLDFIMPQKFGLNYIDREQDKKVPVIIHQSPFGSYQRFIALLLEQTDGRLPFWLVPCQLAIFPLNETEEIKEYCKELERELTENDLRVRIFSEKSLNYRIGQVRKKKIPYCLPIGKEEIESKKFKLTHIYQESQTEELTKEELHRNLKQMLLLPKVREFAEEAKRLSKSTQLLALDECAFLLNEVPRYGYLRKGKKITFKSSYFTLILCIKNAEKEGVIHYKILEGKAKVEDFHAFLTTLNLPDNDKYFLLLDNAPLHRADQKYNKLGLSSVKELLARKNVQTLYLPPYVPEMNPVEYCFNFIRQYVEKNKPKSCEELKLTIDKIITTLNHKDLTHYFRRCFDY